MLCVVTVVAKSGGTFSRATSCATGGRETKESQRNARPFTRWPITESRARRAPHVDDYCSIRVRTCAYMHKGIRNACVSLSRRLVVTLRRGRCATTTKQTYCNALREKQEFFFFFLVACESHAGARTAFSVIYEEDKCSFYGYMYIYIHVYAYMYIHIHGYIYIYIESTLIGRLALISILLYRRTTVGHGGVKRKKNYTSVASVAASDVSCL